MCHYLTANELIQNQMKHLYNNFHSLQHSASTATKWSCQPKPRSSPPQGRLFLSGPDNPRLRPDVKILVRRARPEVHLDLRLDRAAHLVRRSAQSSRRRCRHFQRHDCRCRRFAKRRIYFDFGRQKVAIRKFYRNNFIDKQKTQFSPKLPNK